MTSAISPTGNTDIVPSRPLGQLSVEDLLANPTAVFAEAQKEDKRPFLGVPHIITRVTYRPGMENNDYVSVEALIGNQAMIDEAFSRRWNDFVYASPADFPFRPGEKVIYNDGSTGLRRQLTSMLYRLGLLGIANVGQEMSIFDTPYWEWEGFEQSSLMNDSENEGEKITIPDFTLDANGNQLAVVVYHGLRVSIEPKYNKEVYYLT